MEETKKGIKKININDYIREGILGEGSFSKVRLARRKKDGQIFSIKVMKKAELIKTDQVDHILNEVNIVSRVNHPMIVNFEGFHQDCKYINILMEYVGGGELYTYLREEETFKPLMASFYASQVVLVFEYLHKQNIIYRDLKPQNILIAKDGYLKLTDFGFAKQIKDRTFTLCGTPEYLSPEVLLNQGHGKSADWWTLGILIYEMISGLDPFNDTDPMKIYDNILKGNLKFNKKFDINAKSLIKHLLVADLSKRYGCLKNGVKDIKDHRFFANISFPNILCKKMVPQYKPILKEKDDTSHFLITNDSLSEVKKICKDKDPFFKWL